MENNIVKANLGIKDSAHIIFRIWNYCKNFKVKFYITFFIGCTATLYYAYINSFIVREFTKICVVGVKGTLGTTLIKVGVSLLWGFIVYPISFRILYVTCSKMAGVLKKDLFRHTGKLPISFIESNESGDVATRVTSDYSSTIQLISYPVVGQDNPFALIFSIIAIGIIILYSNIILGIISILLSILSIIVINKMHSSLQEKEHKVKESVSEASQEIVNLLTGIKVARIFGLNNFLKKNYSEKIDKIYQFNFSLIRKKSFLISFTDVQSFLSFAGVVVIGLILSTKGIVDIPTVTFIATLQMEITSMVTELGKKFSNMQKYIVGAGRVFEYLDAEEEIERMDQSIPNKDLDTVIEIRNARFKYNNSDTLIFDTLNLNINNGEKLALVGGSGGGKSTLLKILLEFVDLEDGEIKLFGNSIDKYSRKTLRSLYSYVPQNCYLIDDTIEENVRMGNYSASTDEVERAIENAYLKDFVDTLPDGIKTSVGEMGSKLSGGQRQRVALARAFLKDAPIILLDEATSALDTKSEEEVQKALFHLLEKRTAIIVAHRLSTIESADRIVVLENGNIAEEGNHKELMESKGKYFKMYEM